jgi:hypothetical protein
VSGRLLDATVVDFLHAVGAASPEAFLDSLAAARHEHQVMCGHRPERVTVTDIARGVERVMGMDIRYAPIEPGTAIVSNLGYQTEVTWRP